MEQPVVVPQVRYLSSEQLVTEILEDGDEPTAQEQQYLADWMKAQSLVGLMPEDYEANELTADRYSYAAALYFYEEKKIVILTDRVSTDATQAYSLLIHELVHAQQDARYDRAATNEQFGTTFDRYLGLTALIEGEAMLYQNFSYVLSTPTDGEVDWRGYFEDSKATALELAAETATPSIAAAQSLSTMRGMTTS